MYECCISVFSTPCIASARPCACCFLCRPRTYHTICQHHSTRYTSCHIAHTFTQWEGRAFKLTALYAPGEPGFSVHIVALCQADEYGPVGEREVSCCWPPDVTAAVVAELDRVLGLRPLAVRGT